MRSTFYEEVGARLKARREKIRMRQAELAESIGLSRTSVTNIELGRQRLFLDQFAKICRSLEIAPSEIISESLSSDAKRQPLRSTSINSPLIREFLASVERDSEDIK